MSFLVNNLTRDNLEVKAEELKKSLKAEMWPWFCNYMVIRRVAQEANHQNLYLQVGIKTMMLHSVAGGTVSLRATTLRQPQQLPSQLIRQRPSGRSCCCWEHPCGRKFRIV